MIFQPPHPRKIAIVEDQQLFLDFLVKLVGTDLGHNLVGTATDGPGALDMVSKTKPDLIILDILIPKMSGIIVATRIRQNWPRIKILALSSESDPKTVHQVTNLNLAGFIDKNDASLQTLTEGIQTVLEGGRFVSKGIRKVVDDLHKDPLAFQKILTRREQEVLTFIGGGFNDAEIGNALGLSPASVQSHRRNISRKLGLHNTPDLIQAAQAMGFWQPEFNRMDLIHTYHLHR